MSKLIKNIGDLKEIISTSTITEVVNNYILSNKPICFEGRDDLIFELRKKLSDHFGVHLKNIEIVGSAKLGISLNPVSGRLGMQYDEQSDIDLVIVSNELFDLAWNELTIKEDSLFNEQERLLLKNCYYNIPRGYISPNNLPSKLSFYKNWWEIFYSLSSMEKFEKRKIRGRLFKNWWFVEKYYSIQLAKLSE